MEVILQSIGRYINHYEGLPRICWRWIFVGIIQQAIGSVFYYLSIYFVNDLHLPVKLTGLLIACYGIGAISGGYLGGKLSDIYSSKTVLSISLVIQSIIILSFLVIRQPLFLGVTVFFLGNAVYSFSTSNSIHVLGISARYGVRLKAINILTVSSNLGLSLAALIIGSLANEGFNNVFKISGLILLLLSVFTLIASDPVQFYEKVDRDDKDDKLKLSFNFQLGSVLFCVFLAGFLISQLSSIFPIYLEAQSPHNGIHYFSCIFALNTILVVCLQAPLVNYLGKFNNFLVMAVGASMLGSGIWMLTLSLNCTFLILGCLIYTVGEMLFFALAQSQYYRSAPASKKGAYLGFFRMTFATSRMVGPIAGGFIYQHMGAAAVWGVCVVIGMGCTIICGLLGRSWIG